MRSVKTQFFKKLNWSIFLLAGLLWSCSEVIDLDTGSFVKRLVVDGRITNGTIGNQVKLSFTSRINDGLDPISSAQVVLLEEGDPIASYQEDEPGLYVIDSQNTFAREDRSYELEITLADGSQYRSLPAVMPGLIAIDEPRFEASVVEVQLDDEGRTAEQRRIQLFTNTRILDEEEDFYLRWNIYEAYAYAERLRVVPPFAPIPVPCYIDNDITGQQAMLFDGSKVKVPVIRDLKLSSTEVDTRFAFTYFYNVVLTTMDRSAFLFNSGIDVVSNLEGSIFDTPPGIVDGNLVNVNDPSEEVLGYFEVVRSDTTRVRIIPDDLPFRVEIPCPLLSITGGVEPRSCTDCLLLENSTTVQPYYWF